MLTDRQENTLTGGGDSFDHYHSADRVLIHSDRRVFDQLAPMTTVTVDYTVTNRDDYLLIDSTAADVTIALPPAKNSREIEFTKIVAANSMILAGAGTDTINGSSTLTATTRWTSIRLKAITGGWLII